MCKRKADGGARGRGSPMPTHLSSYQDARDAQSILAQSNGNFNYIFPVTGLKYVNNQYIVYQTENRPFDRLLHFQRQPLLFIIVFKGLKTFFEQNHKMCIM